MHVSKSCLLLTLFAAGLTASTAVAGPPECKGHGEGTNPKSACSPYDCDEGCCAECPKSCGQPCKFCCEEEACPCPPECRGACPPCPPSAYLPAAIRRALGYDVRQASCSKEGCRTGGKCSKAVKAAAKAGCGCQCGCANCTCGKSSKIAFQIGCNCNCGCDKCACGKAGKLAQGCPFAHVFVRKPQRGVGPFRTGSFVPPVVLVDQMAKLIAENAALKAKLEMITKHAKQQREMEQALMKAKQQIAHFHAKQRHSVTPQEQVMAQMIQMNAEQTARKDEVLVELLNTLVQLQAENRHHGGTGEKIVAEKIEQFETKIHKLERLLERVHCENDQLRARVAELIKARRNVQYRTKTNRINRYKCGTTSDVDVDIEAVRDALNKPVGALRRSIRKDNECPACPRR